jgi:hypothetical protein
MAQIFTGALVSMGKWWITQKDRIPKEELAEQLSGWVMRI